MDQDKEITAMAAIANAMVGLDEATQTRILRWALDRFKAASPPPPGPDGLRQPMPGLHETPHGEFADAATLFHAANPQTDVDKALVIAYWVQEHEKETTWASQRVNTILKNLGHGVAHITRALDGLMDQDPKLVIQVQKSGTTQQARKQYKVTHEGILAVKRMLRPAAGAE